MKKLLWFCYFLSLASFGQEQYSLVDSKKAQEELNETYTNPETSILLEEDLEDFKGLDFFPLDEKYIVEATFVRTPDEEPFEMPTTTDRTPIYVKYAEVYFTIDNKELKLNVYQETSFEIGRASCREKVYGAESNRERKKKVEKIKIRKETKTTNL